VDGKRVMFYTVRLELFYQFPAVGYYDGVVAELTNLKERSTTPVSTPPELNLGNIWIIFI